MSDHKIKFLHLIPVLDSSSVQRDVEWYQKVMGFKNVYDSSHYSEGPNDYAVLEKEHMYLHLQFQYPKDVMRHDLKFEVKDIEALFAAYVADGLLKRDQIRRRTPWNTTEFMIKDPNGHRIFFLEEL